MKTIVSNECRSRLLHASLNGSIIAGDILRELKQGHNRENIISGSYNYFSTKRIKTKGEEYVKIKIRFTACCKNLSHKDFPDRGNPQAPWLPENRTELEPSGFAGIFKNLPQYGNYDMEYFCSAITVDSKVNIRMYSGVKGFFDAYNEENYSPEVQYGTNSLHNSCMRDETSARNAADFYTNFAGARIIVAKDASNNIMGRAVVWPEACFTYEGRQVTISVLDRIYFTHIFVIERIRAFAEKEGIHLRKKKNDSSSPESFTVMNNHPCLEYEKGEDMDDLALCVSINNMKWHKKGVPYLDTFSNINLTDEMRLELANHANGRLIAQARSTNGIADRYNELCACCGKTHHSSHTGLCNSCFDKMFIQSDFGAIFHGKSVRYKNKNYPDFLFKGKRPLPAFTLYEHFNIISK